MHSLNISGYMIPNNKILIDTFLDKIKSQPSVKDFKIIERISTDGKKLKLGLNEFGFTFNLTFNERLVPIRIHTQLDVQGENIEVIETFTGIDFFFDLEEYRDYLIRLIQWCVNGNLQSTLKIVGESTH